MDKPSPFSLDDYIQAFRYWADNLEAARGTPIGKETVDQLNLSSEIHKLVSAYHAALDIRTQLTQEDKVSTFVQAIGDHVIPKNYLSIDITDIGVIRPFK